MSTHSYYEAYWSGDGFHPDGRIWPELERLLDEHTEPGWACLDVGCGDGGTTGTWLAGHGRRYTGVDISANAVAEAQSHGLNALHIDDASSLPFDDGLFNAVMFVEVLEHLFEPHVAVAEARRVLRPGGVLIATVPNVAYWRRRADLAVLGRWNPLGDTMSVIAPWRDPHLRFFTPATLSRMLEQAGFVGVRVGAHGGSFARDIPGVRRVLWRGRASAPYRAMERMFPALLGYRLHGVAVCPPM